VNSFKAPIVRRKSTISKRRSTGALQNASDKWPIYPSLEMTIS